MAIKLYEKDINKHINWAGDETTGGLPVSGEMIQKFIKESLDGKFGFMYYDKDPEARESSTGVNVANHTPTNQYIIFSDAEDFALWAANPADGNHYIKARFDAPAPATVEITDNSDDLNTILLSDKDNQNLSFTCVVKDKSNNIVTDSCSVSISISNNVSGNVVLPTYNSDEQGKSFTFDFNQKMSNKLGTYLFEGVNIVKCTITSDTFNVSTTISFQYRVLNLNLISSFDDNQQPFNFYNTISLKNSTGFETTITANGAGQKFLRVFIDGVRVNVLSNDQYVNELYIGANNPELANVIIPFADVNGNLYTWAEEGKHSLQMYFYIKDNNGNEIKSQTLYYDFVLVDNNAVEHSYILFKRTFENNSFADINPEDSSIFPKRDNLYFTINAEQYLSFSTDYVVLDTFGRGSNADGSAVVVNIELYAVNNLTKPEYTLPQAIPSGTGSTFTYTVQNDSSKELHILSTVASQNGVPDEVIINVNVKQSDVTAKKATSGLELELTAINRSNTENEEKRTKWSYTKTTGLNNVTYNAVFENVLWNSQNGWIKDCLVLNNGATVTIPMNIFGQGGGVTFEIEFETENVQDDDAVIMKYGSEDGAGIFINACNATLQSNNGINIHTNYKDGARQKIQFIFGYNQEADADTLSRFDCPYLMYMVVNGILDRVAQFKSDDNYFGTSEDYNKFVIGNLDGKVTTKIHSIRVYTRPLTLDECVDNYIADSSEVRKNFLKNDIYNEGSKTINVNKILSADLHIPVMTIYGNITDSIVQVFNKKANVPVDILYQDPMHPEFNYFARDAWMSNQGTSSMNYPRRNFRSYFNKESDSNTLRGFASADRYKYETRVWWGLTNTDAITRIQMGTQDPDEPFTINGIEYKPLRNKKTLKDYPQEISYDTAIMFVHSGIKIYSDKKCDKSSQIKNLNKYMNTNPDEPKTIWVQGAYARYKTKDLFTDRWTLKCDYAESSMTHNAGVGRLWGDVMRDVEIGTEGFTYDIDGNKIMTSKPGATNAQRAMQEYNEAHAGQKITINGVQQDLTFGDIRTSCDGYPIIIINRPRIKEGNKFTEKYGDPIFLGLYNIMTDKGSTPLFGFEDLKDEDGNTIFDAGNDDQRTECWECLQNGSRLAQMNDATTDDVDGSTVDYTPGKANNEDRPIFKTYEARWPDNKDLNDTRTDHLETVIRFVNFCKDAVSVRVGAPGKDKDGYELSDFTQLDDLTAQEWFEDKSILNSLPNKTLYLSVPKMEPKDKTSNFYAKYSDGTIIYDDNTGKPILMNQEEAKANLYKKGKLLVYYRQTYASQVTATSTGSMEPLYSENETNQDLMIQRIYDVLNSGTPYVYILEESDDPNEISYEPMAWYANATDEIRQWYYLDKTFDRTIVTKTINTTPLRDDVYTGRVFTYDGKRMNSEREQIHPDAWVTVYLTKNGNNYTYVDELGHTVPYASGEEVTIVTGSGEKVSKGTSFKNKTKFEYFQDQKYEHFDVWKLACYYVYLMRFAAVDQVIKNTMMTTEDGKHYYFINYDNDTTLGVRNDGYLAYDWKIDRETYDDSIGAYAYAGFGSVLWNILEQDKDFMDKVQIAASAMAKSNVLTYDIAIDMFNNQQAGTWCERLYNESEMYKYIGTYNDIDHEGTSSYNPYQNTRYLPFLQGSRASHRDWWLRHRFDLYDSKWGAGEYANAFMQVYYNIEASPNNSKVLFNMKAASKFYFTVQDVHHVTLNNNFVELNEGETWAPTTISSLAGVSDPIIILGAYNMDTLDFSIQRESLGQSGIVIAPEWTNEKYVNKIKRLIIGGDQPLSEQGPCTIANISGIDRFTGLEEFDIRYCINLKNIDLSPLKNLRKFLADGSAINSFIPAEGVMLEEVSLPTSITTLRLNNVTINNLTFTPTRSLTKVEISNVNGEALEGHKLFEFILDWYIALKKAGARLTDYSCTLSFNTIELEQYYGNLDGELATDVNEWIESLSTNTPKKIKSLDLINAIKRDFGLNNNGVENFNIISGIIKLYGDNENGGLTQENYNDIISATFKDSTKKLWNDTDKPVFRADSPFHFNSNDSIFVTVSAYDENYKEPVNDNGNYTIIAGQKAKITTTILPLDNSRIVNIIPYSINPINGMNTKWNMNPSNGQYYYTFSRPGEQSLLTNDNGTAVLDVYEYTDTSAKSIFISITETTVNEITGQSQTREVSTFNIGIENAVKPTSDNIQLTYVPNDGSPSQVIYKNQAQNIDVVQEYDYVVAFTNQNEMNIDVKNVNASFNSNTVVNTSEYGELATEFSETLNAYVIKYVPTIPQNETTIPLYIFVELKDSTNSTISSYIRVSLKTKAIENITLTYNENPVAVNNDGTNNYSNIEHYVTSESDIKTVNNQKVVSYRYYININPSTYNIPVKSMQIVTPDGIRTSYSIVEHYSDTNPLIIDYIDINMPVSSTSLYQIGEFTIMVIDSYDVVKQLKVNVTMGYFVPNGIYLARTMMINGVEKYDITENANKVSLLMNQLPQITYKLYTYSKIGSMIYIWGDGEQIQNYYSTIENVRFLSSNQYPNAQYSELNSSTIFPYNNATDDPQYALSTYLATLIPSIDGSDRGFIFTLRDTTATAVFSMYGKLRYTATFNNVTATYDDYINVERTPALATNFNIADENIIALGDEVNGETVDEASKCLYYLDRNLNLYTYDGFMQLKDSMNLTVNAIKNYIIALIFVYNDNNGARKYTSLDPWKLMDDHRQAYTWWSESGSWYNDSNNGVQFANQLAFHYLLGRRTAGTKDISDLQAYNESFLYKKYYDYYRILCAMNNNPADGGEFTLRGDIQGKDLRDICDSYYEGTVELTNDSVVTDPNMIFYYINDYADMGLTNIICKPLSLDDIKNVMNHYEIFKTYLNALAPENEYHLAKNLFDTTDEYKFHIDHHHVGQTEDGRGFDEMVYPGATYENFYTYLQNSKTFWYFDVPNANTIPNGSVHNKENVQVAINLRGEDTDIMDYNVNNSPIANASKRLSPQTLMYCLFGPRLV